MSAARPPEGQDRAPLSHLAGLHLGGLWGRGFHRWRSDGRLHHYLLRLLGPRHPKRCERVDTVPTREEQGLRLSFSEIFAVSYAV